MMVSNGCYSWKPGLNKGIQLEIPTDHHEMQVKTCALGVQLVLPMTIVGLCVRKWNTMGAMPNTG